MTLFEFVSVGIAIVVSFGVVRLLDGFNYAVDRERRYWPHLIWVAIKLLHHFNIWWTLWARHDVSWSFAAFLAQLGPPVVLYLQASTLVSSAPQAVESWREHFYRVRRKFFGLNIAFGFAPALAGYAAGSDSESLVAPFFVALLSLVGLLSDSHRAQMALAVVALAANVALVVSFTYNPAVSPWG